jgi:phospholipid/cholesterol/gamma-HCH transport system substrate-binding protein
MKRSVIETVLGAAVLVIAIFFLVFSYKTADVRRISGYDITASFTGTGGLAVGDDVRISGVKVGSVNDLVLNPKNYLAIVKMSIKSDVKLPDDTAAIISSDSLLGGRYLELQPGASDTFLKEGGKIQYTQAPQNLEELLGKFIFSMQGSKKDESGAGNAATPSAGAASGAAATGQPLLSDTSSDAKGGTDQKKADIGASAPAVLPSAASQPSFQSSGAAQAHP